MLLKFFIAYPYVVYSIIGWVYIFAFIGLKGIKRLWPAAILGGLILFCATKWLMLVDLYKFNITFLLIFGIPFFYILWGAASGVIFAYYLGSTFLRRLIVILGFAGLVVFMESLVEKVLRTSHVGKFNDIYEYIFDVMILFVLAFLLTNLFKARLEKEK